MKDIGIRMKVSVSRIRNIEGSLLVTDDIAARYRIAIQKTIRRRTR